MVVGVWCGSHLCSIVGRELLNIFSMKNSKRILDPTQEFKILALLAVLKVMKILKVLKELYE